MPEGATEVVATELEITFVDASPPPLPAGDYRIRVEQAVSWTGGSTPPFASEYDYTVAGPRFVINPEEVHSMFPPPGNRGHFQNRLPHLVFARRSVPWERTVDNSLPQQPPFIPWLWVLSLDEDEIRQHGIAVKTVTIADVLNPPARVLGPDIRQEVGDGDPATTQLLVIDVPVALLNTLVPSKADLTDTAGARVVSVVDKELTPATEDGWFSAVMANRFPKNGRSNTQFLVSMEGYGTAKTDIFFPNQVDPARYDAVRLVMLISWSFVNVDDDQTFDQLMKNLTVGRLQRPSASPDVRVTSAFNMGYAALNHVTRVGQPTVSWYRGPLLPLYMEKDPPPEYPDGNYPNSDAPLRFDPEIGMFDVTYSVAWELGRLLGMQDGEFAAAIARLRDRNVAAMHTLASRSLVHAQLRNVVDLPRDFRALLGRQMWDGAVMEMWGSLLGPALTRGERPILGPPADPSKLARRRDALAGLLTDEQIQRLAAGERGNLLGVLMTLIREMGRDR